MISKLRIAQGISMVVGVGLAFSFVMGAKSEAAGKEEQYAANEQQIEQLKSQLDSANSVTYVKDSGEATTLLSNAESLGKEVCDKQNEMFHNEDPDKVATNADYIGERLTDSSQRYRGTWLLGIDDDIEWQFCSTYDFTGDSFPVVWLAHSKTDGELLGYATANYVADSHKFDDVKVTMTYEGTRRVNATDGDVE